MRTSGKQGSTQPVPVKLTMVPGKYSGWSTVSTGVGTCAWAGDAVDTIRPQIATITLRATLRPDRSLGTVTHA